MSRLTLSKSLIDRTERIGVVVSGLACAALVVYKLIVAPRLNIGPDEFWTLHLVHTAARHELSFSLDGVHVHILTWLVQLAAFETTQVVIGRLFMVLLLGGTAVMVWRLGRHWFGRFAAAVPPLLYLSSIPVVVHGGAFRSTSLLAFLLMAVLLNIGMSHGSARRCALAGGLFGLATAVTLEAVLFLPMLMAWFVAIASPGSRIRDVAGRCSRFLISAALAWACAILLHWLTSQDAAWSESLGASKIRMVWPARTSLIGFYAAWQPIAWGLIVLGTLIALAQRRFVVAATALSAVPALLYVGAYSYFLVVVMAPLSLLAGMSVQWIQDLTEPAGYQRWRPLVAATILFGLLFPCAGYLERPLHDRQRLQRDIVAGVHEIFENPVSYLDGCGMIATFPKVNGLLTRSSVSRYREAGKPALSSLIRERRPAFVLMNAPLFSSGKPSATGLLEADRQALAKFYPRYWGPIRIAGGQAMVEAGQTATIEVPFPADYRFESREPMLVQGVMRQPNEVFAVTEHVAVTVADETASNEPVDVRLVLATAGPRPKREPEPQSIFVGL